MKTSACRELENEVDRGQYRLPGCSLTAGVILRYCDDYYFESIESERAASGAALGGASDWRTERSA